MLLDEVVEFLCGDTGLVPYGRQNRERFSVLSSFGGMLTLVVSVPAVHVPSVEHKGYECYGKRRPFNDGRDDDHGDSWPRSALMFSCTLEALDVDFANPFMFSEDVDRPCARCYTSGLAIPREAWPRSCASLLSTLPRVGKPNCSPRTRRADYGRNGGPTERRDVNSSDDALTPHFVPMWFTFTRPQIGRGGANPD